LLSIRKTKTLSGSISVQIVYYKNRKVVVVKHIGSGNSNEEVELLIRKAKSWIKEKSFQIELFPIEIKNEGTIKDYQFKGVTHHFAYHILEKVAHQCGLDVKENRFLFDFAIMRLIEPTSKLRTITLLNRYFDISYSERSVYRKILKLINTKDAIETLAVKSAKEMLKEELSLVLYDVTTLYFETFKSDELRVEGFSKDNKPQQPQIVIGLIVTRQGYPLSYEVFAGNTFEGKTMLDVLDNFTKKNGVDKPIVVADAAMLSYENIAELKQRNLSYIVGARLANTSLSIIKEASDKLQSKDGKSIRIKTEHGELIIEFSKKRYGKDKYEMEKQILKAKLLVEGKLSAKRTKFVKHKNKENQYTINEALIEKARLLLGMKGYYTNIDSTILTNQDIITRYHDLWHVEQSFRIAKSDLASRPVFHYKNQAVRSHILICFTALMFSKYLEIKTKLPIKQVIDSIWNVTETKLFNKITNTTILLQSEVTSKSKNIIDLLNKSLSY